MKISLANIQKWKETFVNACMRCMILDIQDMHKQNVELDAYKDY